MANKTTSGLWLFGVLAIIAATLCTFQTREGEVTIVARFGNMSRVETEAGLHFRLPPPIDTLYRVDMRTHVLDPPLAELLTAEKRALMIDSFVAWRVSDPQQFLVSQGSREGAERSIAEVLRSSLIDVLKESPLQDIIRVDIDERGRSLATIADDAKALVSAGCNANEYGVEILYVGIERVTFHGDNMDSIVRTMRAERRGEEEVIRSRTTEMSSKIDRESSATSAKLLADAEAEAMKIRGEALAEEKRIEAEARRINPELYDFISKVRTLEAALAAQSIIMGPDHFLLDVFRPPAEDANAEGKE